ncbi:MAG: hypothetical protein NZ895_03205 [Archaeoglobaceae archaeon]|nr:hypothetical protein [Archaeoglobaceae archaeon]MCX8152113.1 hypothetical protein [Archaeoglobaceae archaeon]MDW8013549.1 hypothetical protein [Archaeoglobaceae archaeon]
MLELLITVILLGYDGVANLTVVGVGNFEVVNGTEIPLQEGTYIFELSAMEKVFVKEVNANESFVIFNLKFTNSTKNISIFYHTILSSIVSEVVVLTNRGDENFEGDLTLPMPDLRNLEVVSSSLDYKSFHAKDLFLTFNSLLIPARGEGQIVLHYELNSNVFYRDGRNASYVILTDLDFEDFRGLVFQGERTFNGVNFKVLSGENSEYLLKIKSPQISYNLLALLGIFLSSLVVFIHFYDRRGKWKL